jgi:hypothetical protein
LDLKGQHIIIYVSFCWGCTKYGDESRGYWEVRERNEENNCALTNKKCKQHNQLLKCALGKNRSRFTYIFQEIFAFWRMKHHRHGSNLVSGGVFFFLKRYEIFTSQPLTEKTTTEKYFFAFHCCYQFMSRDFFCEMFFLNWILFVVLLDSCCLYCR